MYEDSEDLQQISYWPSVSDLFMTLFIITLVLLGTLYYVFLPISKTPSEDVVEAVGGIKMSRILEPTNQMRRALGTPELKASQSPGQIVNGLSATAIEVVHQLEILKPKPDIESLKTQLSLANSIIAAKDAEIARLNELSTGHENEIQGLKHALNDKPPIIKIAEGGKDGKAEYRFASGSAMMGDAFKEGLRDGGFRELATEILTRNRGDLVAVDTLEVIGHTDGISVSRRGNLDGLLPSFLAGNSQDLARLTPGSNNDLGLLRALAIKEAWLGFVAAHEHRAQLAKIDVRCYSAGQTVPEGFDPTDARLREAGLFKTDNIKFRRIEIRLTKLR